MKPSHPPNAATWLLKHLTPEGKSESILGDLEEEFATRQAASWYWRQVFTAIFAIMLQEFRSRWPSARPGLIRFGLLLVAFSIPIFFAEFAGHRAALFLFTIVLVTVVFVLAIPLEWLDKRIQAAESARARNPIARAVVGFTIWGIVGMTTLRLAELPGNVIFILVLIPGLVATVCALRHWGTLFSALAEKFNWNRVVCGILVLSFVAASVASRNYLGHRYGRDVAFVFFLMALGCIAARPAQKCKVSG